MFPPVVPAFTQGGVSQPKGDGFLYLAAGQNRVGIPFWLVGKFTTHVRTYSGWIESNVKTGG